MPRSARLRFAAALLPSLLGVPSALASPEAGLPETGLRATPDFYVVRFAEPPLARYAGEIPGLEATNPRSRGEVKLDPASPQSRAYLEHLDQAQGRHFAAIEAALGRSVAVVFRYRAVYNGAALRMSAAEADRVSRLPGVVSVLPDVHYPLHTDRGPIWIGAPGIWNGTDTGGLPGTKGEDIVFGDIDTGVNMLHPSFSDSPADGYTYVNPNGTGNFVGWCNPAHPDHQPAFVCNDKLIGAWDFVEAVPGIVEADGPEDDNGHGSHTASTAVGNTLVSPAISGVAPHASLITYDACFTNAQGQGQCPFAATSASVEQAVLDGVDAINYSIGGGSNPWGGDIDTFFLDAVAAGIFVSASAGNSGPGPSTVAHLGPWMITVGNSTHDRVNVFNDLTGMSGGTSPPADMQGASRTGAYGPDSIVHARAFDGIGSGDPLDGQCGTAFPAGTWTAGEIVMCDRGQGIARVLKCANVAAGGAGGCILGNLTETGVVADPHAIPAIHVDQTEGNALRTWLASGSGHSGSITASAVETDPAVGDIMNAGSSRGPNVAFDALKPDVTNPGTSIFAAVHEASIPGFTPDFANLTGTSMSSPHTAGAAILVKDLHPTWTPAEVKSALMTTGDLTVLKEDAATAADAFDIGAGRVDLSKAGKVGITLDETAANFLAANPASSGDPRTLNVPSMQHSACAGSCSWTRTVDSVAASSVTWTATVSGPTGLLLSVTPPSFALGAGASQALTVQAQISFLLPLGSFVFGQVTLTPSDLSIPAAHFPVAVVPTAISSIFADGFESGNTSAWSLTFP